MLLFFILLATILSNYKHYNPVYSLLLIRLYSIYALCLWIIIYSNLCNIIFNLYNYYIFLLNNGVEFINYILCSIVICISTIILGNAIDYLSITDNLNFLLFITVFQFCMINFILTEDLIIKFIFGID